jgi:RNA polymerase sigma-70 factor (ECF subfamily)
VRASDDLRDFYAATYQRLVMAVAGITGDLAEAEECVSEAFVRAVPRWQRIASYDDPEAWVRHVAVNVARSRWRRSLRGRSGLAPRRDHAPPLSENHVALVEALRRLPAEQREAVVLFHVVDLTLDQVAMFQGVPIGTVKTRLARGRQALAALLNLDDEPAEAR